MLLLSSCKTKDKKISIKGDENIVVLKPDNTKVRIQDLDISSKTLFFWFSDMCCHACVEKEIARINDSGIASEVVFIKSHRPLRGWKSSVKTIRSDYHIEGDLFCLYSHISFTDKKNKPYYFVYERESNKITNIFYPDRYDSSKSAEYFFEIAKYLEE